MTLFELPSNRTEDWRWSDLSSLSRLMDESATGDFAGPLPWIDSEGPRLVFIDGRFVPEQSAAADVRVEAAGLAPPEQKLADHAARLARSGYVLDLGPDRSASGLIQIICVSTGGTSHLANRIRLETGAQASIVETHLGSGWSNNASHFELAKGARLMRALRVDKKGGAHSDFASADVGEGGSYDSCALVSGCDSARIENRIRLEGPGAYGEAGGALLARGRERLEGFTVLRHQAPVGSSRQVWRSVADDRSTCSVSARVEVARDAQRTDAEQSLKGLLLGPDAAVNAKPELEIFADDVKCAHGATVGELDRDALFYLESRGIDPELAQGLLTRAFLADAIDRIGEEKVRDRFRQDVEAWFDPAAMAAR